MLYVVSSAYSYGECTTLEGVFSTPEKVREFFDSRIEWACLQEYSFEEDVTNGGHIGSTFYYVDTVELDIPGIIYGDES